MDKDNLIQLEIQTQFFWPFKQLEFWEKLKTVTENCIAASFSTLREAAVDFSSETDKSSEEINEFITIIENQYLDACKTSMANIMNKMNDLTYIPNTIKLYDDNENNHKALVDEHEELKKEFTEQKIFITLLKQELEEYARIEPILNQAEQLNETLKSMSQFEVPEHVKELLVELTSGNQNFRNSLTKF